MADHLGNWNVCSKLSSVAYPYTLELAEKWIASHATSPNINCAIETDGQLIGCIAQDTEFGYWLAEPFWGQGIMTEAARAFVSYLFRSQRMDSLRASYFKDNPASGAVLHYCGFTATGESKIFCLARNTEVERIDMTTTRHVWEQTVGH